ncbi:hypothetical protein BHE90_012997 [Fusarium euwallaceae]|uniref:Zn(2)-C6 fungal-type domain-containing protein n=1 Tax=Fusarium euwallaceae TaxID=1147111 RepID=A0A430LA83_9HYPO|nr:hypothetical protein BHE90_012997 [Fusarium euwallaceae]
MQPRKRNSNACDACRARKTKCEYNGANCYSCVALEIPCTRNMPKKRRGPVNRYVTAQRQHEACSDTSPPLISHTPGSTHSSAATDAHCGLNQLGPPHIIAETIEDWFELVHCVSPVLHRASFLRRLANGDASRDPEFCNLVVSVCAATISVLKRSRHRGVVTLSKCMKIIRNNDPGAPRMEFTLEWCQTKYNLAVAYLTKYGTDSPTVIHLLSEAAAGVRYLLFSTPDQLSFISRELLKRLLYLIFAGQCTFGILGRLHAMALVDSATLSSRKPLFCTDQELEPHVTLQDHHPWHGDATSYIPGLVHLVNLFQIWYQVQQERPATLSTLQSALHRVQAALDDLPRELRWRGGLSRPPCSNLGTDVQIVNLYITQIHIRSNLVDQIDCISKGTDSPAASVEPAMERQRIIDDMLAIVCLTPDEILEVNGYTLVLKLRDIGLTLLTEHANTPNTLVNLDKLLAKLERLDQNHGFAIDEQAAS